MFSRLISIVLILATTLASGVLCGRLSHRWGPPANMRSAAARLERLPSHFGNWKQHASLPMSATVINMLQCAGYIAGLRQPTDRRERTVALLLGPPGPIAVHTPEICFSGQDYRQEESRRPVAIGSDKLDTVWSLTFRAKDLRGDLLRVCYGWTTGRRWSAADQPAIPSRASHICTKSSWRHPCRPGA